MTIEPMNADPFLPHGFCYQWKPALIWLHLLSDILIAIAYFAIPFALLYFAKKRRDLPFRWLFLCFGIFITACGATHVMEVVTLWFPAYWASGTIKLVTALASLPTAILVVQILPEALNLASREQMRVANEVLERQARTLRESEDLYRDLVEHSQHLICTHDLQGILLSINEAPLRILGYSRDELLNKPLRDFVVPEARTSCDQYLAQIKRDGFAKGFLPVLTKDGRARLWEYNNTLRIDGVGTPIVRGMAHDVTEQRRAEKALRISEEKFSKAFQASPVEIAITTLAEGRFIDVNETFERQMEFAPEEVIGRTSLEIGLWVDPSEREKITEEIKNGRPIKDREVELRTKSGQIRVKLYSTQPIVIAGEECLLTVCEDITNRKKAEEALRLSEEKFRLMAENIKEIFWLLNPKTLEVVYVSPAFERICERSLESIRANPVLYREIIHPDDAEHVLAKLERLERTGEFSEQFRIVCPGNCVKWVEVNGFTAKDSTGKVSALVGTAQEITVRKKTEQALRTSEGEYRSLFLEAPYGICRVAPNGTFILFNDALVEILGYTSAEELRLKNLAMDVYQDSEERRKIFEQLKADDHLRDLEVHWKRKDGRVILVRANVRAVRGDGGEISYLETMVEDVTQHHEFEEHLRRMQKMEAVALLAGGIAHDFNNILAGILGYGELILKSVDVNDARRNRLQGIVNAALQGRNLTSKLLAFSHDEVLARYPVNVDTEIRQMEDMLRRLIDENILLTFQYRCKERVLLGSGLLYQIILNLAINAKDAMPKGGRLCISTTLAEITPSKARPAGIPDGRYLRLEVSDTGCGMSMEVQQRIFEPFFTTKPAGQGTGLGLFTVFSIVRQCSGHIKMRSKPEKGSTFDIYFPIIELDAPESREALAKDVPRSSARNLVMVVEDDVRVRNAVHDQLVDLGYSVVSEETSMQAVVDIRRVGKKLDLVVTDVVMPELNGPDLVQKLRQVQPNLLVLYITGYANQYILSKDALGAGTDLLHKPFTQRELGLKVHSLLCLRSDAGTT